MIKNSSDIINMQAAQVTATESDSLSQALSPSLNKYYPTNTVVNGEAEKRAIDKYHDICLRVATIDNPTFNRISPIGSNALDINRVVNDNLGKVCLRWEGVGTGILNIAGTGEKEYGQFSYNAEDRTMNEQHNSSTRETVDLTYPIFWSGPDNWCGINYLPPVGAKVIVGFAKNNKPMILGYLNENYKACYPPLKPGEIVTKGYGNNYIHNRWSNKLDLKAWANTDNPDLDDCNVQKSAKAPCVAKISLDADNGFIEITVNGTGLRISEDGLSMTVKGKSSITMDEKSVNTIAPSAVTTNAPTVNSNYGRGDGNG